MHHEAYCRSQNEQQYASQRIRIVNTHLTVRKTVQPGNFSAGKTQDTERFIGLYKKIWNFACTGGNDSVHGIVLGTEKQIIRQMTFIHVLS